MTIEEQREYAATKIMGWRKNGAGRWVDSENKAQYEYAPTYGDVYDEWQPDQDRNHLWLVIEKIGEGRIWVEAFYAMTGTGPQEPMNFGGGKVPSDRPKRDLIGAGRAQDTVMVEAWENPAKALEAIVKAHKQVEEVRGL